MRQWLISNPNKRKKNYRRFITNWLSRSQEKGGTKKQYQSEYLSEEVQEQTLRERKQRENKQQKERERIQEQKIKDETEIKLRDINTEERQKLEAQAKEEFKKSVGIVRPERERVFIDGWIRNWVEIGVRANFSVEENGPRAPP